LLSCASVQAFAILPGVTHIIVIPPHIAIIGMPVPIVVIIRSRHSMNMSFMDSSIGVISHFMPVGVMEQVILHIIIAIGIIMPPVIGIGIMPVMGIIEPIIGIGIMVGIGIAAVIVGLHGMVTVSPVVRCKSYEHRPA